MPKVSTSYKKGQSGNPKGRPKKGTSLTELMQEFLDNKPEGQEKTYRELFIQKCLQLGMKGDIQAIKMIWNYMEGMPKQRVEGIHAVLSVADFIKQSYDQPEENQETLAEQSD